MSVNGSSKVADESATKKQENRRVIAAGAKGWENVPVKDFGDLFSLSFSEVGGGEWVS
jgi:hypothetical protein